MEQCRYRRYGWYPAIKILFRSKIIVQNRFKTRQDFVIAFSRVMNCRL